MTLRIKVLTKFHPKWDLEKTHVAEKMPVLPLREQLVLTGRAFYVLINADKYINMAELVDFLHHKLPSSFGRPVFCLWKFAHVSMHVQ